MIRVFLLALLAVSTLSAADWSVDIQPKAKLKAGKVIPIDVAIRDLNGKPISGLTVEVVLTMVDMDHGELQNQAKAIKPGIYQARMKFMMGGAWNIEVRANLGDASVTSKKKVDVAD